jgi:hypothetical protein
MQRLLSVALGAATLASAGCAPLVAGFDFGGDEAHRFVTAVSHGEPRRAYDELCPATRFGLPYEAFEAAVDGNQFLLAASDISIDRYESGGGLAVVQRGWLESPGGVTAAAFYLSKIDQSWCLTGIELGGTPVLQAPGATTARTAAVDRTQLAAPLRNEAYQAYGLGNPATRRYRMTTGGDEASAGTQRAELIAIGPTAARFRVVRAGGLASLGSLEVSLESDGIHLVGSSEGAVQERTLILPARLEPGTRWQSEYVIGADATATRYVGSDVVEGRETVGTPAGTFDAIRVVSDATVASGDTHGTVRTVVWYAPDVGSVRTESETTIAGGATTKVVVELLDRGTAGS